MATATTSSTETAGGTGTRSAGARVVGIGTTRRDGRLVTLVILRAADGSHRWLVRTAPA